MKLNSGIKAMRKGTSAPASLNQRLKAWRRGFSGTTWLLYDLDNRSPADYVPDRKSSAMADLDGPVGRSVLKNKLLFERIVGEHARVPPTLAVVERGTVTGLRPGWEVRNGRDLVSRVIEKGCPVVLKPMDSSEGRGVRSLEVWDGKLLLDKREVGEEEAAAAVDAAKSSLVVEMLHQDGFSGKVFPGSVNTARVITMVDPRDGEPFIASALHRFGTQKSAPTDNTGRGGIRCLIDIETGRLSVGGASWAYDEDGLYRKFDDHPDTGVHLTDVVLEGWEDAKASLLQLVKRLPFLIYVGWDVALTQSGIVLIEGNHSPNITQQVAGGYLADPRIRRFLHHHGVVD